ncbi:hypothetical protein HYFRA_00014145, partial [Hymenoscyphus fraxineus]
LSIALSALTSLDWKRKATSERHFAEELLKCVDLQQAGDAITISREGLMRRLARGGEKEGGRV